MSRRAAPHGVLCVGRLYCDLVFLGLDRMPAPGREVFADGLAIAPGGGALIVAAQLAALGRPALLVSRLGTDALAAAMEPQLAGLGIDLVWLERAAEAGPQVTVAMPFRNDRAFLTRRAGRAAPARLIEAILAGAARHVHIAELATLLEVPQMVAAARKAGLTISVDCGWDPEATDNPAAIDLLGEVDLFLPNADEAMALTGERDLPSALDHLSRHIPLVVVKAGGRRAMAMRHGHAVAMAPPDVPVLDPTGAGDAFNAGFLDCWLQGDALETCLAWALACGSLAVQRAGGATPAGRAQVAELAASLAPSLSGAR